MIMMIGPRPLMTVLRTIQHWHARTHTRARKNTNRKLLSRLFAGKADWWTCHCCTVADCPLFVWIAATCRSEHVCPLMTSANGHIQDSFYIPPFPKFYSWDHQTSKWTRTQITLCTSCKYEVRINTADTSLSGCRVLESGKTLVDIGDIITWCLCWKQGRDKQKRTAIFFFRGATAPSGPGPPHYRRLMIILRHTTLGKIPLDEWSARRRETSTSQHTTLTTDGHPWRRRDSNPQS